MHNVRVRLKIKKRTSEFFWIKLWIYFSAWASVSGWLLSASHFLNRTGYLFALFAGIFLFRVINRKQIFQPIRLSGFRYRLRQPLCALFFAVSILSFIGGSLYAPNNYDFLTYRFPRILHWASENQWHWIHTMNPRMNYSATGFEWLMMPLLVFFRTDRFFFLINLISFCFLPGLIFSLFRNLGISRKTSWTWMWLLPSGYCYVLQSGSVANDSFSTTYILAALIFALKAAKGTNHDYFRVSFLAICLFTGAKLSNVPLVLPWLVLVWPIFNHMVKYSARLIPIMCLGLFVSIVPVLVLNQLHAGVWTGSDTHAKMKVQPVAGLVGNALQLTAVNLIPPIFPCAPIWNRSLPEFNSLKQSFPRFSVMARKLQIEEVAGVGLGVTLFLLMTIFFAKSPHKSLPLNRKIFVASAVTSIFVFMALLGSESFPRLFAPYYTIAIAAVLLLWNLEFSRNWNRFAFVVALSALIPLILSPSRPLWPARSTIRALQQKIPGDPDLQRAFEVYSVYRNRADSLAPLRTAIPESVGQVGFLNAGDDPESPLWIPFGSRKIVDLNPQDRPCESGVSYVVFHENALPFGLQIWIQRNGGRILVKKQIITKISSGPRNWFVVQLNCGEMR